MRLLTVIARCCDRYMPKTPACAHSFPGLLNYPPPAAHRTAKRDDRGPDSHRADFRLLHPRFPTGLPWSTGDIWISGTFSAASDTIVRGHEWCLELLRLSDLARQPGGSRAWIYQAGELKRWVDEARHVVEAVGLEGGSAREVAREHGRRQTPTVGVPDSTRRASP